MANLTDSFSDAAVQDDGKESVAPAFNQQATTVKDAMTTDAAIETPAPQAASNPPPATNVSALEAAAESPAFETARIVVPRDDLPDEAFAAVKRGDVQKLKSLLDSGLDANATDAQGFSLLDRAQERFTTLRNAVEQNETETAQDDLIKKVDPDSRADAGLAALMLASANGNVDVAQMVLNEMEDDELEDDDDDAAEEIALEHGNMSVFLAILARKQQRSDFNKVAKDEDADDREPAARNIHDAPFQWVYDSAHSISETIKEDAHALARAFGRASHVVGHATSVAAAELCEVALAFCSQFLHLNLGGNTAADADPTATPGAQQPLNPTATPATPAVKALTPEPPAPSPKKKK